MSGLEENHSSVLHEPSYLNLNPSPFLTQFSRISPAQVRFTRMFRFIVIADLGENIQRTRRSSPAPRPGTRHDIDARGGEVAGCGWSDRIRSSSGRMMNPNDRS